MVSKKYVIVDIDGTLARAGDRTDCLKSNPPDWDTFYARCGEDSPISDVVELVRTLGLHYTIVLCSGRRESCRADTEAWMSKHGINYERMLLRPTGDKRHDTVVKPQMLDFANISLDEIAFVLEDRNSMVKKWRELGLICLQVAEGDF